MAYRDIEEIKIKELEKPKYLQELREKIEFKGIKVELKEAILQKFLRSRNYDVKETAGLVKNYVRNFDRYPQFFKSLSFAEKAFQANFFNFLPEKTTNGEPIAVMRLGVWEPDQVTWEQLMASTVYSWEHELLDEGNQMIGGVEIVECSNLGSKQFTKVGISEIKLISEMTEGALPIKWRKIFLVNANNFIEILYSMAKPFLSKELKERIVFVSKDLHELYEYIPKNLLSEEFGGTASNFSAIDYYQKIKQRENELLQMWQNCRDK